jgi:UDP-N-acetylmuramoyl-tripeptide--D-alanyl-D-alanine ligase
MSAAVPGGGLHRALTLAAVLAILVALGRPPQVAARLSDATIPAGRGRREQLGDVTLIDDSYNANPASMTAALALLAEAPTPRYAVLGEMLELGRDSAHYHRALASACAGVDGVVCVGEGMRALYDALPAGQRLAFADRAEDLDLAALRQRLRGPCTVLIKGSNRVFWAVAFAARLRAAWC